MPQARSGIGAGDIAAAIDDIDHLVDISKEDLEAIVKAASRHARERLGAGQCAADIMARDLVTLSPGTPVALAWERLAQHRLSALPVIDANRQVVGMLAITDFLKGMPWPGSGWRALAHALLTRQGRTVAAIMTTKVCVARADQPLGELVGVFSDGGRHSLPVVDGEGRLVGMSAQSDMVAALALRDASQSTAI